MPRGTVTTLALGDFGIELGGETVVLFTAVTDVVLDEWRGAGTPEHDRVDAARVDLLTDPALVAAARAEFEELTRDRPYRSPLPEGQAPPVP